MRLTFAASHGPCPDLLVDLDGRTVRHPARGRRLLGLSEADDRPREPLAVAVTLRPWSVVTLRLQA